MSEPDLDLEDMLLLCGEPEVDHSIAPAAQLRALIDGLITQRARAEAAEATIERLRATLEQIANHPESENKETGSYKVGWAFWNVQQIARAALQSTEQRT